MQSKCPCVSLELHVYISAPNKYKFVNSNYCQQSFMDYRFAFQTYSDYVIQHECLYPKPGLE